MLQAKAIDPNTFSLLKKLMELPSLKQFYLVGGTALSLRFGHRTSIDLDLFSHEKFDQQFIVQKLEPVFGEKFNLRVVHSSVGIFCFIGNVKVDFVHFPHGNISPVEVEDGIRLCSIGDISAMKIQAILGRANKKDFWNCSNC
ncbi:MAG: nucleotidyl transferase AbiEii/AbiGii toxin family protein [Bacteroidales bacterium]|nr:nucleotidyl transferase AbiEii/AbiGii toxin family protein [Bacteroidales bacterium]